MQDFWNIPCWVHLGSVLFGPAASFREAYETQQQMVSAGLPKLTIFYKRNYQTVCKFPRSWEDLSYLLRESS